MTVFERIDHLAKKQGKSVKEVAKDLGFGPSTIYKWKVQTPNGEYLEKVADYFKVSVDYLLGRTEVASLNSSNTDGNDLTQFFKAETADMTEDEVATLEKEWKEYLVIRKRMMRGE